MSGLTISNEREIQPMQLSLEQLNSLKVQHEEELQELSKQMESLLGAKNRFVNAKSVLEDIVNCVESQQILIPLNSSLYVPGHIVEPNKVMVELGTGYFCEKSVNDAKDLVDRKTQLVSKSLETIESVAVQKRKNLEQLTQIMKYKISLAQQQPEPK